MMVDTGSLRFAQGGASSAFVPNISALTESGRVGELDLDIDILMPTELTSGASELAHAVLRREILELAWYASIATSFASPGAPHLVPFATFSPRLVRVPGTIGTGIENRIRAALETEPVEDGYSHPAEVPLEEIMRVPSHHAGEWVVGTLSGHHWNPSLRAGLLRLLSRQRPLTEDWRLRIIRLGLSSPSLELRDAAVQAAESWEESAAVQLLQEHEEPCSWLADYVSRVIQDLMR